jgi:hypothetical protein
VRRANFLQACVWPKLETPSQIGTRNPANACVESQACVWNKPSHIVASCHLWHSQGREVCTLKCSRNSLEQTRIRLVLQRIPMCNHGSSPFLVSLSSTMWQHSLSSTTR